MSTGSVVVMWYPRSCYRRTRVCASPRFVVAAAVAAVALAAVAVALAEL